MMLGISTIIEEAHFSVCIIALSHAQMAGFKCSVRIAYVFAFLTECEKTHP